MLHASEDAPTGLMEDSITVMEQQMVCHLLRQGKTVIVDDTNLSLRGVLEWLEVGSAERATWHVEDFTAVPLETCLKRNRQRDRVLPEDVIREKYERHVKDVEVPDEFSQRVARQALAD